MTDDETRVGTGNLALTLLTLAVLGSIGYNTFNLVRERQNLHTIRENQQAPLRQVERVRAQIDSIGKRTVQLAQQGNTNASLIIEHMARRGFNLTPPPAAK